MVTKYLVLPVCLLLTCVGGTPAPPEERPPLERRGYDIDPRILGPVPGYQDRMAQPPKETHDRIAEPSNSASEVRRYPR